MTFFKILLLVFVVLLVTEHLENETRTISQGAKKRVTLRVRHVKILE